MKNVYVLASGISKLEGGSYNVDSIIKAIQTFSTWALRVGIALSGVALIIGFILYAVADVDQKARVKQRIIQTMFGIVGIILAISIVNLIIDLF
jgi:F0F1-type ATP synthase membrane subunit c/vacuolar-type H+-ATPase subunit K